MSCLVSWPVSARTPSKPWIECCLSALSFCHDYCTAVSASHYSAHNCRSCPERFVFAVSGLPSLVAKKTLYTHRTRGLGLGSLAVLYPTRVAQEPPVGDYARDPQNKYLPPHALHGFMGDVFIIFGTLDNAFSFYIGCSDWHHEVFLLPTK